MKQCLRKIKYYCKFIIWKCQNKKGLKQKKRFFLLAAPNHGNLGDQAILKAELTFFKDFFPKKEILSLISYDLQNETYFKQVKKIIKNNDLLFIHGGGFLGDLYPCEEELVKKIILSFPNNPIIILPQTIYYSETELGNDMLKQSVSIYENHNNLIMFLREKISYDYVKSNYSSINAFLVPDIVLYLQNEKNVSKREFVTLFFRKDKEKKITDKFKEVLIEELKKEYNVQVSDTIVNYEINNKNRDLELQKLLNSFASSKFVITDRLHGMIFAVLSGTPCLVLPNTNHKILSVYNSWLKENPSIYFVDNIENISTMIDQVAKTDSYQYNFKQLMPYYQLIVDQIQNILERL